MGVYLLRSDAAQAHDIGGDELKVAGHSLGRARNFETEEWYEYARNKELHDQLTQLAQLLISRGNLLSHIGDN
jgi:hypothetical protein